MNDCLVWLVAEEDFFKGNISLTAASRSLYRSSSSQAQPEVQRHDMLHSLLQDSDYLEQSVTMAERKSSR